MKKIVLSTILAGVVSFAFAQKGEVNEAKKSLECFSNHRTSCSNTSG